MENDLIEEARNAGQAYIDSFNGDLKAVCADLRRRSAEGGRTVVSLPPRRPQAWELQGAQSTPQTKKVG